MTKEQLEIFYKILETKNSWGKNEIKTMLLGGNSRIKKIRSLNYENSIHSK